MRVLIADDSPTLRRLLESTLIDLGYEVTPVDNGQAALDILYGFEAPMIAILDWMMPGHTGPELCRMIREHKSHTYTYLILLTARDQRQDLLEGLGAGADDYIVKPFDRPELEVRLRAGRRIVELQIEIMQAQEALREQATRDALTKCWNRYSIIEILERELRRAQRERRSLGLVIFDLDHFKRLNDTYGHLFGDEVLKQVVNRVSAATRSYDAVGRYGGEEFLCVLPGCDQASATKNAERMREALALEPIEWQGLTVPVTSSFGVTAGIPSASTTPDELIRIADEALYLAKMRGRDSAVFAPFGS